MKSTCIPVADFNLEATLDSGQVFGFQKKADRIYHGVLWKQSIQFQQIHGLLTVKGDVRKVSAAQIRDYFDLDRDLEAVYRILQSERCLAPAFLNYKGLRLIRQDSWEALAGFIVSSNNNVKRIQHIWRNLSKHFGGFPSPEKLARSHERILRQLGLGYRAPFLLRTAQFLSTSPDYLDWLRSLSYAEAKERVLAFPGIGEKVADCVLLYGFQKYEAFPVDVWILRSMRKHYFRNRKVSEKKILNFGQKRWGQYAGYVQQYLFHSAKNGIL